MPLALVLVPVDCWDCSSGEHRVRTEEVEWEAMPLPDDRDSGTRTYHGHAGMHACAYKMIRIRIFACAHIRRRDS